MFKDLIDMEAFLAIVKHYGAYYFDAGASDSVLEDYIDTHVRKKEHIFKLFGEKLKVEKYVDIAVTHEKALHLKIDLAEELISSNSKNFIASSFLQTLSTKDFLSNTISKDYSIFNVVLKKGMKVSKALAKLTLPELAEATQIAHSMYYQKLFMKGRVVLSIDPCDYVTMSSNASGWRSCHRLNGGEYSTGPLAYLNDPSTVICYVESKTPCTIQVDGKSYTHTNKVWRQLALVSPELQYSIQERQYPNDSVLNENAVSKIFLELFEDYHNTKYKVSPEETQILKDLHLDYGNINGYALYYNDIMHNMFEEANVCYPESTSIKELLKQTKELKPIKGASVFCIDCGCELDDSGSLYCEDCYDHDDEDDEW